MAPIPIAFIDAATAMGGAEAVLLGIVQHIDRQMVTPHLICHPGPMAVAFEPWCQVHQIELPRLRNSLKAPVDLLRSSRAIRRVLHEADIRVAINMGVRSSLYAALASGKIPLIWYVQDILASGWYTHFMARRICLALAPSRAVADALPPEVPCEVVPNFVDLATSDAQIAAATSQRERLQISPSAPLVGMVGSLRPWKGHADFIEAMAKVHQRLPSARFVIAGGDIFNLGAHYEADLRNLAKQHGLEDALIFTGQLAEPQQLVHACDVLVHCSLQPEAFGIVIIEALAASRPVVAYDRAGPHEIIRHDVDGLLVAPDDAAALAEGVIALLLNPAHARELGRHGRQRVAAHYNSHRSVDLFTQLVLGCVRGTQ